MPATTYQLFFAANLAFILTNVYGWVLKWFYRPRAYDEEFQRLFPAQRSVGTLYLLQALELPYLIQLGLAATSATDPTFDSALLYANTFALLIFPIQMLIMCESYFFPSKKHPPLHYLLYLPAALLLALLLPSALGLAVLPAAVIPWVKAATALVFLIYFWRSVRMAQKIGNAIRDASEQAYADEDDFPVRFAGRIQWLPIGICAAMAINYLVDDPTFKAVRDVIFTGINVWFCILTLNPWRTVLSPAADRIIQQIDSEAETDETTVENTPPIDRSLSEARLDDLASRLDQRRVPAPRHQHQVPHRGHLPTGLRQLLRHDQPVPRAPCHQPHQPATRPPAAGHCPRLRILQALRHDTRLQVAGQARPQHLPPPIIPLDFLTLSEFLNSRGKSS